MSEENTPKPEPQPGPEQPEQAVHTEQPAPQPEPPLAPPPTYYQQPAYAQQPKPPGGFQRFVGHRATQLVAALVLGLVVGGGTVAAFTHHAGPAGVERGHFRDGGGQRQFPRGGYGN
ncbi:hypothetical protein GCM10010174_46380 [Kutzneria viridogrisea]|uniref:Uncharacterized protein n=2 Tax=Kutzneria TaxID=43356 RepID=A0ABR6BIV3_9PSEU|nr:hypothetical protein [Kutzneria albida]AHH95810.1 putative membrane protein [Kutzneria albida DSM 43870]MBA8926670.1 hypothetical protein [Kutzneria viridogrisea]